MRHTKTIGFIMMLLTSQTLAELDNYLEGISVVGEQKIAYLSIEGHKISVKQGEEVTINEGEAQGIWQVIDIKEDSIQLKNHQGYSTELRLDTRLPLREEKNKVIKEVAESIVDEVSEEKIQVVRTPFGEFTLKNDDDSIQQTSWSSTHETLEVNESSDLNESEEEIQTDHHLVQTPFGNFVIKEGEEEKTQVGLTTLK